MVHMQAEESVDENATGRARPVARRRGTPPPHDATPPAGKKPAT